MPLLQCSEYISVPEVHKYNYKFLIMDGYMYCRLLRKFVKDFYRWVKCVKIGSSSVVSITAMHR